MTRNGESHQKLGGWQGMDSQSEPPEGSNSVGIFISDFKPLEENKFLLF
jgi:hypothetical protein